MSLVSLGTEVAHAQQDRRQVVRANEASRFGGTADQPPQQPAPATGQQTPNALTALTKYLPTETITIYLAGLSLLPGRGVPWFDPLMIGLTPVIVFLAYLTAAVRAYNADPTNVPSVDCELTFKMLFSALAFYLWIHTLPNSLSADQVKLFGFLAILCSPFFGFLEGICPLMRSKIPLVRKAPGQ